MSWCCAAQFSWHAASDIRSLCRGAVNWSNKLRQAAAVCHSLTPVDRGSIAGDVAEKEMFRAVEAHFLVTPVDPLCLIGSISVVAQCEHCQCPVLRCLCCTLPVEHTCMCMFVEACCRAM